MRFLYFAAITVGGAVGWWIGSYEGIMTALIVSTLGSLVGIYLVYRLARDHL
jgi:hypothetical protein